MDDFGMDLFTLGCEAEAAGEEVRARDFFRRGGEAGDSNSWVRLGYMFHGGIGGPVDDVAAMDCYKKAWRHRNTLAAYNIALLYEERDDNRLRFRWLKKAAEAGYGSASLLVAQAYLVGYGVRRSSVSAAEFARIALGYKGLDDEERLEAKALLEMADQRS
jgi:TPR repeat protein